MAESSRETTAVTESEANSKLWHRRLERMSEKGMKVLASMGNLPDLKFIDIGLCEDCVLGK